MRRIMFRRLLTVFTLLLSVLTIQAQNDSYTMTVELGNGTKLSLNTNEVKEVSFADGKIVVSGDDLIQTINNIEDKVNELEALIYTYHGSNKDHEYVDLGLSVKWATCNVGATKPYEYGDYYAWGETEEKTSYTWENYKYCRITREGGDYDFQLTKYNTSSMYEAVDNKIVLDASDDVAHVKWGGNWRMPTRAEQEELRENCTWTWYGFDNLEFNGTPGYKVTSNIDGYTDRFIFLPVAGRCDGMYYGNGGEQGYYWSSSVNPDEEDVMDAYYLGLRSDRVGLYHTVRCYGFSVRPVCP